MLDGFPDEALQETMYVLFSIQMACVSVNVGCPGGSSCIVVIIIFKIYTIDKSSSLSKYT